MPRTRHARDLEAVPRSVRQVLHAPQRRPRASARKPGRPTSRKKEALCARAEELADLARVGQGRRRDPPAAGRLEDRSARCAATSPRRSGSASAPRATRSSIATSGATRSSSRRKQADREALVAELEALARSRPPKAGRAAADTPPTSLERVRSLRTRWNQSTLGRPPGRRSAQRALRRRARARDDVASRTRSAAPSWTSKPAARRWRSWSRRSRASSPRRRRRRPTRRRRSPTCCARRWPSNTIGGRAGEEAKWRAMADDVRQAQASWSRLGPGARARPAASSPSASTAPCNRVLRSVPPPRAAAAAAAGGAGGAPAEGTRRPATQDSARRHLARSVSAGPPLIPHLPADDRVDDLRGRDLVLRHRQDVLRQHRRCPRTCPTFSEPRDLFLERRVGAVRACTTSALPCGSCAGRDRTPCRPSSCG